MDKTQFTQILTQYNYPVCVINDLWEMRPEQFTADDVHHNAVLGLELIPYMVRISDRCKGVAQ